MNDLTVIPSGVETTTIEEIVGKTPKGIFFVDEGLELLDDPQYAAYMVIVFEDVTWIKFYHEQDCCEEVAVEEVVGDLSDLIGLPLITAEEFSQTRPEDETNDWDRSATYTFYRFATAKGDVAVRWLGESNGYYSESVNWETGKGSFTVKKVDPRKNTSLTDLTKSPGILPSPNKS